jgi:hypothetical protein
MTNVETFGIKQELIFKNIYGTMNQKLLWLHSRNFQVYVNGKRIEENFFDIVDFSNIKILASDDTIPMFLKDDQNNEIILPPLKDF